MYKRWSLVPLALAAACVWGALGEPMTEIEVLTSKQTHCTYGYAYEMYGAHCASLHLTQIPSLKSGIEILDFSDNKLSYIYSDTLSSYTSIKYLYLSDNRIVRIDDDAFVFLTVLETLDLSKNVIMYLPSNILQLTSLRRLYIGGNHLIFMTMTNFTANKVIRAPLELLDISDCKLEKLPEWGILPQLTFYNISNNPLTALEPKHFAVMCNLEKVDLSNAIDDIPLCHLRPAISWFQEKRVNFQLEDYSKLNSREFEICPTPDVAVAHNETFNRCKSGYLKFEGTRTSRRTWLTISGGLAGFLVGFILLLYLIHRHNVTQTKTAAEKMKANKPRPDGDTHASAILLNDVS